MMNFNFRICLFCVSCCLFHTVHAQTKVVSCAELKNGTFFSYPKNSADRYFSIRDGEEQTEVNLTNGDTILWQVKWMDDCRYSLSYISGAKSATKETIALLKKHKLVYQIQTSSADYYVFTGHIDKASNTPFQTDTMWLHEKVSYTSNELFYAVNDANLPRKAHFSDTSAYALIYLYRPGKFSNSLSSYLVYGNDNLMWVARNKSGYLFKVVKEGRLRLSSRLFKDESSVDVDIQFGKKYYIKSMVHWGVSKRLYNFKLEMAQVSAQAGELEFEEVNFR